MKTLLNVNPIHEFRAMEEVMERLFQTPMAPNRTGLPMLAVDIVERGNNLVIRAAVPGVQPNELDVTVDNGVLTIRGETKHESASEDEKVYRREISTGAFTRSVRLPENVDVNAIQAEFRLGMVEITIPRIVEEAPKPLKITVRNAEAESN
jgi:HSP20 family protein